MRIWELCTVAGEVCRRPITHVTQYKQFMVTDESKCSGNVAERQATTVGEIFDVKICS